MYERKRDRTGEENGTMKYKLYQEEMTGSEQKAGERGRHGERESVFCCSESAVAWSFGCGGQTDAFWTNNKKMPDCSWALEQQPPLPTIAPFHLHLHSEPGSYLAEESPEHSPSLQHRHREIVSLKQCVYCLTWIQYSKTTVPCESILPPWTLRPFATIQASNIKI